MALQDALANSRALARAEIDEKVQRAQQAIEDTRCLIRRANGKAVRAMRNAVREGFDTRGVCDEFL